jgi:predicted  nucleic acid-binding Zn-ribbon protein
MADANEGAPEMPNDDRAPDLIDVLHQLAELERQRLLLERADPRTSVAIALIALAQQRVELERRLPDELVARLVPRDGQRGNIVAAIVGGCCSGCNRMLPAGLAQVVFSGAVETCPSCGRLLAAARAVSGR